MNTDIQTPRADAGNVPLVHIVLVETSHPGNIGAAARAMKTMGLGSLRLVNPAQFPSAEATARASGADDVLAKARIFNTLDAAVADCTRVLAASARQRSLPWPVVDPRGCAAEALSASGPVAIVFGREKWGLSNEELALANFLVFIPTNPDYSSLNLAMAVQIVVWELRMAMLDAGYASPPQSRPLEPPATADEMARFYAHLEEVALDCGFLDPDNPRHLMRRIRRLFNRAQPDQREVNIMRGLLSATQGAKMPRSNPSDDNAQTKVTPRQVGKTQ